MNLKNIYHNRTRLNIGGFIFIMLCAIAIVIAVQPNDQPKFSFHITQGWNLFSLPTMNNTVWMDCTLNYNNTEYSIQNASDNELIQSTIYYYDNGSYRFVPGDSDNIVAYKGYWLYSMKDNITVECNN